MKNQNLYRRFLFSLQGLKSAWGTEKSFRAQVVITCLMIPTIAYLKASLFWWAIFIMIIAATLAAELFNTALEYICDLLHPHYHPQIGRAKDCAAAAVLVLSLASIFLFFVFLWEKFNS
ncbi:MAG: diacylglycerol kinase [Bacteriovorax sp.]